MRVLVTSARMPFAVDQIRKLGEGGHTVVAADTFSAAPGLHSRFVSTREVVPPPATQPREFAESVRALVDKHGIDLVLPQFEEVFALARHRDLLDGHADLFSSDFSVLARLHDKVSFAKTMRELGLHVAESVTATSRKELWEAIDRFGDYFARAAFSRGGVELLTNCGPLAGDVDPDSVEPTESNPFVVQPFIEGTDVCSMSVVHHGRVAAHSTYEHPLTIEHAGGIEFLSIDAPETLEASRAICEAMDYNGQVSFDFLRDSGGTYWLVECNIRPTAGSFVLTPEEFCSALIGPAEATVVAPAGRYHQISVALVRDMVHEWRDIPRDAHDLFSAPDIYAEDQDPRPLLYTFLSLGHVHRYRKQLDTGSHSRKDIMAAQFFDIAWNGEPIP
ncbi:MAG: ATP-grasp domain-containing protein [Actinomycetia bacterium]|nr:ATP-grasp domain-containing protein [Actinomycetes bacterium]